MTQYSKRMVIAHWLTLVLLLLAWYLGDTLSDSTDESRATLLGYIVHTSVGIVILLLITMRLFFRSKDGVPPAMGNTMMDKVAHGVHHLLYLLLLMVPISGVLTVIQSSVGKALLAQNANMLPKAHGYHGLLVHSLHGTLVNVLIAVVIIHVLGALKHQFIAKDRLLERMILRRR